MKSEFGFQDFEFTGSSYFIFSEGTIWTEEANGNTWVYADVDGGGAEIAIQLLGVTGITASDFLL